MRLLAALSLVPLSLLAAVSVTAEDAPETRFVLRARGRTAGYGWFRVAETPGGLLRIEGETVLKLLERGRETVLRSRRSTLVGPDDRIPLEYRAVIARDGQSSEYVCRRDGGALTIDAMIRGSPVRAGFAHGADALLDYNAPEHFEIFLRGRMKGKKSFQCAAVVPEMMAALPLHGRIYGEEEVEVDGGRVRATRVEFVALGMAYRAWLDEAGRLARIEVPSQGFEGVRTGRRLDELDLKAADLVRGFHVPMLRADGVSDPGPAARMPGVVRRARFRVRVKVGENRMDDEVLSNVHQAFIPAENAEAGWISGVIEVRSRPAERPEGRFPEPEEAVRLGAFLAPEAAIESDAQEIRARAAELIPTGTPPLEAARHAAAWVHGWMSYETQLVSARAAHEGRVGDCLSMSRLTIALLRAHGVPARVIGGLALGGSRRFGQHHWVEVWAGVEAGWIQIDPTYGQSDEVDAFHLDLWREGTLDGSRENQVVLEGWE